MEVRRRIGQVELKGPVVEGAHAECGASGLVLVFRVLDGVPCVIKPETRELGAADDLEENRLVLTRGHRITRPFHGIAEVLGRQRRAVAVLQIRAQVEGELGGVVVVLPRFSRRGDGFLAGIEPGKPFIDQRQDVDLVSGRAFLGIDDVRVERVLDAQDLVSPWAAAPGVSIGTTRARATRRAISRTRGAAGAYMGLLLLMETRARKPARWNGSAGFAIHSPRHHGDQLGGGDHRV